MMRNGGIDELMTLNLTLNDGGQVTTNAFSIIERGPEVTSNLAIGSEKTQKNDLAEEKHAEKSSSCSKVSNARPTVKPE